MNLRRTRFRLLGPSLSGIARVAFVRCFASWLVLTSGCGERRPKDAALLQRLAPSGCNRRLVFVWIGPAPDPIPNATACIVATAALNYIGQGGAQAVGVPAGDTAILSRVIVVRADMQYPDGEPTQYYWEVGFARPNANTSVSVRIDRVKGTFDAKLSEPIDTLSPSR